MTKYDWSKVPKEVKWIATDSLGYGFGWIEKPEPSKTGQKRWNDENSYFKFALPPQANPFKGNWQDSLEERPLKSDLPETVVKSLGEVA